MHLFNEGTTKKMIPLYQPLPYEATKEKAHESWLLFVSRALLRRRGSWLSFGIL